MNVQTKIGTFALDVANARFDPDESIGVPGGPLPEVSLASMIKVVFSSYFYSSWAVARAQDKLRAKWQAANPEAKKSDAPKDAYDSKALGYAEAFAEVIHDLCVKLLAGYEAGSREGGGDPVEDMVDSLARVWAQTVATIKKLYVNPSRSSTRIAKDEDEMVDGSSFGEYLAAFREQDDGPVPGGLKGKNKDGSPFPFKIHKGETVKAALYREAKERLAAKANGGGVTLGE